MELWKSECHLAQEITGKLRNENKTETETKFYKIKP